MMNPVSAQSQRKLHLQPREAMSECMTPTHKRCFSHASLQHMDQKILPLAHAIRVLGQIHTTVLNVARAAAQTLTETPEFYILGKLGKAGVPSVHSLRRGAECREPSSLILWVPFPQHLSS